MLVKSEPPPSPKPLPPLQDVKSEFDCNDIVQPLVNAAPHEPPHAPTPLVPLPPPPYSPPQVGSAVCSASTDGEKRKVHYTALQLRCPDWQLPVKQKKLLTSAKNAGDRMAVIVLTSKYTNP